MDRNTMRSDLAPAAPGFLGATTAAVLLVSILAAHGAAPTEAPARNGIIATIRARTETLWIFDADFEDLTGDNAGWVSYDRSGFVGQENYWHHDTIRLTEEYLGESTWWCGTYSSCWRQPRGYGNDWTCILEREFPLSEWSYPGDDVAIEWDQRYAMEWYYDYGYLDVSSDSGTSWTTLALFNNGSAMGHGGGVPRDWDDPVTGHWEEELSVYAGTDIRLRYRFESDIAYSCEDQYDNSLHSCKDGAWQLDNITISVNSTVYFYDDSESGNMGWIHDDLPPEGQTGVKFFRGQYGIDFETGYAFTCGEPPVGTWMYAAADPIEGTMVDGQETWLVSPPISIAGTTNLIGVWDMWVDLPRTSHDVYRLYLCSQNTEECVWPYLGRYYYAHPGWLSDGPFWATFSDDWTLWTGHDWFGIMWRLKNYAPPEPGSQHRAGIFLDRQRVGVVQGDFGTWWQILPGDSYSDWFVDDFALAIEDTAIVEVNDADGVLSVYLLASNDGGATWEAYACRYKANRHWWESPPPVDQVSPGSEILYYWEASDNLGNMSTYPDDAPAETFEFSILPVVGSVGDPGILVVDKHGGATAGELRDSRNTSESYYREALDVLGFRYDVYDFEYAEESDARYPDTSDMRYYDTQIWFANREFDDPFEDYQVVHPIEEVALVEWLSQAGGGRDRNLLLTGNEINSGLASSGGRGRDFLSEWLATEFLEDDVGDTLPTLRDAPGGFGFMGYDDRRCILAGGCPWLLNFDAIAPTGAAGSELVAEYVTADRSIVPAGVAYTHPTMGYRTVNLGFGMEFMMDYLLPNGRYATGAADRVDLLANVMDYFGKEPIGPGTAAPEQHALSTSLSPPAPNPSGPGAALAYSLERPGRVTVRIYSVGGRLVRTLVDDHLGAGQYRATWDGTTDEGERAASGVYFVRMEAREFDAGGKLVLLK